MQNLLKILFCLFFKGCLFASFSDAEFWQLMNWSQYTHNNVNVYGMGLIRLNHELKTPYYYQLSENFTFTVQPFLDLEVHYNYIYEKPRGVKKFFSRSRYDFEINPYITLKNGIFLKSCSRYELSKRNDQSQFRSIFRQLFLVAFPISQQGTLFKVSIFNEVFYNYPLRKFVENRFTPMQLSFQLDPKLIWSPSLMVRNFFTTSGWCRSIVVVSDFDF